MGKNDTFSARYSHSGVKFEFSEQFLPKKHIINQICVFFGHFLSLFDTFSARYSHSGIKFEFSEQFQSIKHFIQKQFLKIN